MYLLIFLYKEKKLWATEKQVLYWELTVYLYVGLNKEEGANSRMTWDQERPRPCKTSLCFTLSSFSSLHHLPPQVQLMDLLCSIAPHIDGFHKTAQ